MVAVATTSKHYMTFVASRFIITPQALAGYLSFVVVPRMADVQALGQRLEFVDDENCEASAAPVR